MFPPWLQVSPEVAAAAPARRPVVALESTLIAHGLPWPDNRETALRAEAAVRAAGAVPATVAVWHGAPTVGLTADRLDILARTPGVVKASRRDLGAAVGLGKLAATTVSATMALAHAAGVRVFATGGLGGAHRVIECGVRGAGCGIEDTGIAAGSGVPGSVLRTPHSAPRTSEWDVSADLTELARTPVLVVCSGAKSILDLPRTLEILETLGVPVVGYRTDAFPEFYVGPAGGGRQPPGGPPLPVSARVDSPAEAAAVFAAHVRMGGGGMVLCQPCPAEVAVPPEEFDAALGRALTDAHREGVTGPRVTPFLLARLAELTGGRTLAANRELIVANARLGGEVAAALSAMG
jgi:pseudouridine-5'-phosphate glycosidase